MLVENPQLLGSFCAASMQDPESESAGRAQLVKSARIWLTASEPWFPQILLAAISCSLWA